MEILSNYIVEMLFAALAFLIQWGVRNYLGFQANSEVMRYIEKGIGYGKKAAKRRLGEAAGSVEFDNEVVDQAVKFVAARAPKWLKKAGITEGFLRELVEGELENDKESKKG
jgi:hypothetical protein